MGLTYSEIKETEPIDIYEDAGLLKEYQDYMSQDEYEKAEDSFYCEESDNLMDWFILKIKR